MKNEFDMDILSFMLSFSGLLVLCLAMPKHYQSALGKKHFSLSLYSAILRVVGWLIIGLSFVLAVATAGWSFGPVQWFGFLAVSGLILIFLLPYAPRLILTLGVFSLFSVFLTLLIRLTQSFL